MFFNTHVYYAKRVDKNLDSLKVLGSTFPDFASTGLIGWDDFHKRQGILDFSEHVEKSAPEYQSFVKGIIYHDNLDYTSHVEYKNQKPGYAYANITPELFGLVKKALNLDDATTKSMSHNLIESGVDYHLNHETLEPPELIKNAVKEVDAKKLARMLAIYFKRDENEMFAGVNGFLSFITGYDLRNIDEWIKLFVGLGKSFLKTEVDEEYARKALELSFELTKDSWKEYLETSIADFKGEIKDSI
jgi:hypothetical protein